MRKLMWLTIGFGSGCGLCAYGAAGNWKAVICILAGLVAAVLAGIRTEQRRCWIAVIAGLVLGGGWFAGYSAGNLSALKELDQTTGAYTLTITDYSRKTDYGSTVYAQLQLDDRTFQTSITAWDELSLAPGDRVSGTFRLQLTLPEDEEDSAYYPGKGIFLRLYAEDALTVEPGADWSVSRYPAVLRNDIREILSARFSGEAAAFAHALLLGDTTHLGYALDTAFALSGIRHIVAVSGLHISLLYGLLALLLFRQRHLLALLGIPVLVLFAAVAGFTPSVVRACIMIILMLLSGLFNREYDPPTALSFAALMMLLHNPWAVTAVGLQLSVGCVAGILLFQGRMTRWLEKRLPWKKGLPGRLGKSVCAAIGVSLSAQTLVTPLSAGYFGVVSLVGVATNVLTLWLVNLIFNGLVAVVALDGLLPGVAGFLASLVELLMEGLITGVTFFAELPLSAVFTRSPYIIAWLVFLYVLLVVFLLQREKQPLVLLCCGCLGLCVAVSASWAEPLLDDTRITMLDVGQGQSILLQSQGKQYLVDCGGDNGEDTADIVAETLLCQGIDHLDGVILTHFDRDHVNGAALLLSRIPADLVILPDMGSTFSLPETGAKQLYISQETQLCFGAARLIIYPPQYSGDDNENSLCVLFDTEKCDILITADRSEWGEGMLLRHWELPDVDILVAGHHGAASSTSRQLLDAVTPEIVLISVGENNRYHHPAPSLLQRLEDRGCTVYRTDLHGTITIRR